MRIGISNLLWTPDLDEAAARLLNERGIDTIDIAPTRYFQDINRVSLAEVRAVRGFWQDRGIAITGLQSLLHGTSGLSIFGDSAIRQRTGEHLQAAMRIAATLEATQLVFGSWPNRDRGALDPDAAREQAAAFFLPLAEQAQRLGVCLTIEPISARYGNNFLLDHDQAASLVQHIDNDAFRLTLDIGCIGLAEEDLEAVLERHGHLVSHVQLAEFQLAPLDINNPLHARAGPLVAARLPAHVACIEALKPRDVSSLDAIAQSLDVAQAFYR